MLNIRNLGRKNKPRVRFPIAGGSAHGFTLIELLVVVLSISLLSAVVLRVVKVSGFSAKGRDSQRIASIKKTQAALEEYFSDERHYPDPEDPDGDDWVSLEDLDELEPYLDPRPIDPINNGDDPCTSVDEHGLFYRAVDGGNSYVIATIMEVVTSNDGSECSAISYWEPAWCNGDPALLTDDFCYAEKDLPGRTAAVPGAGLLPPGAPGTLPTTDVCPNLEGFQTSVPWGYTLSGGNCVEVDLDLCANLPGDQLTIPPGYVQNGANCDLIPGFDICPNIPGDQVSVPAGLILDALGDCVSPPTVDICPNLPGDQATLPPGYVIDGSGNCIQLTGTDVCPNITGDQTAVPENYEIDANGNCVPIDVCPNITGNQLAVPAGKVLDEDGNCVDESSTQTITVLTFDGYVDNDLDGPHDYIDTFTIPTGGAGTVTVTGSAEEGHPWPPYNCTPGPDIDPVTGETKTYCDQNQDQETFSVYINDVFCYTYTDKSPIDDTAFSFSRSCGGAHVGTNTLRITHVGLPAYGVENHWLYRGSLSFIGKVKVAVTN
jgi:prepilin-type N-terminal cleavage/methylation domain-containing protein